MLRDDEERARSLGKLEVGLDESYENVLGSICQLSTWKSELAYWVVEWLCCTLRPIKFNELMTALELSKPELYRSIKGLVSPLEIFQMFNGLVKWEEESGSVMFSHYPIKELIISHRLKGTGAEPFQVDKEYTHGVITKLCLKYLLQRNPYMYSTEEELQEGLVNYPFLDYAAKSWVEHSQNTGPNIELDSFIVKLLTYSQNEEKYVYYEILSLACGNK